MPRAADDFEVVVARLDASPEDLPELQAHLSADERSRAARFFFEHHRRRYIVARATLRKLLGARLGIAPQAVALAYGANGKPALDPRFADPRIHFSVSHCSDVALFGFSSTEIGVDIEALRPIAGAEAIAAQFFSAAERLACARLDKPLGFLRCWTRKEALLKGIGAGLSLLPQLDLARVRGWRVHSFFPLPGFIAAVARQPA